MFFSCFKVALEFAVENHMFVKLSPIRGKLRFGKHEKLDPIYAGPSSFSKGLDQWLRGLPFHRSSMFWMYEPDPPHEHEAGEKRGP